MSAQARSKEQLCLGLTEQGKLHALKKNHSEALRHYREALRISLQCKNNDIFFHHTTQCIMESLEHIGSYELVNDYCQRSEEHFSNLDIDDPLIDKQRASNLERLALSKLLGGQLEDTKHILELAQLLVGAKALPITDTVLNWLNRGYQVSQTQIRTLQKKHNYFIVRKDAIRADMAIQLPPQVAAAAGLT